MCQISPSRHRLPGIAPRNGFSLTELLVAMTIGLMVMAAVASLFAVFGRSARMVEADASLADSLRAVSSRLRYDLTGVTVDLTRPAAPESGTGYFEYIEGTRQDFNAATPEADTDDALMFTSRALGRPFSGKFTFVDASGRSSALSFESPYAEICWFCKQAPDAEQIAPGLRLYRLYRRQLLVSAYVGQSPFITPGAANVLSSGSLAANLQMTYLNFDLSVRNIGSAADPVWAPNSLGDLTRRETRFLHNTTGSFPFVFAGAGHQAATFDGTARDGEDVLLGNVIGFDVRAFDPEAGRQVTGGVILQPGDPGFQPAVVTVSPTGAYVDIGWGGGATVSGALAGGFQSQGAAVASGSILVPPTYDSWSRHYEFNGVAEGTAAVDSGADGVDTNSNGVPDDRLERQASPPYPVPLRGIEVRIRCYEPTSKQIRQITVRHSFVKK